jgi:hypothetical protein
VIWYLDACSVIRAQDAGHLEAFLDAAGVLGAALAEEVYLELTGRPGKEPKPSQIAARNALSVHRMSGEGISLGSPAASVYAALRAGRTGVADAGECQSIALASQDPTAQFATAEAGAAWLGVIELEGRVRALPSLLRELVRAAGLPMAVADDILATAGVKSRVPRPSWWPGT